MATGIMVKVTGPKEMLVGFTVTPYVYRYDLDRDTLVKLDVRYDETFCNTDSTPGRRRSTMSSC